MRLYFLVLFLFGVNGCAQIHYRTCGEDENELTCSRIREYDFQTKHYVEKENCVKQCTKQHLIPDYEASDPFFREYSGK